jgi:anti-repressor protein
MSPIISKHNFSFNKNKLNTFLQDTEIWFIAKEVSEILGYSETSKMLRRLDDDEKETVARNGRSFIPEEFFGNQGSLILINESGLYSSIIGSKLPTAKDFKKWVTKEVLPSIRKTGSYSLQKEETQNEKVSLQKSLETVETGIKLLKSLSNLNPMEKIELDNFYKIENGFSLLEKFGISFENSYFLPTEIGNMIGMSGAEINLILEKKGFQFRDENGIWKPTSSGKDFCLEIGNKFNQLKWKISTIL